MKKISFRDSRDTRKLKFYWIKGNKNLKQIQKSFVVCIRNRGTQQQLFINSVPKIIKTKRQFHVAHHQSFRLSQFVYPKEANKLLEHFNCSTDWSGIENLTSAKFRQELAEFYKQSQTSTEVYLIERSEY